MSSNESRPMESDRVGDNADHEGEQGQVAIQRANEAELSDLASWYAMIDPEMPDRPADRLNTRYLNAFRSGILGSALGHGPGTLDALLAYADLNDQLLARTLVLSARRDSDTFGMLVMGPPVKLYNHVMAQTVASPQRLVRQMHVALMVGLCKLEIVCIAPDQRERGMGTRLIRDAIEVARNSAVERIYGQFRSEDRLATFYRGLGFTVAGTGQPVSAVANYPIQIHTAPTENAFHMTVGPRQPVVRQRSRS